MRILTKILILTFTTLTLNAQTTMCFKENHKSMSTIEDVKLDGGICAGKKSVKNMNKDGWTTDNIKINGNNYVYIFKKLTDVNKVDMNALEASIIEKLQKKEEEKKVKKRNELYAANMASGKKMYIIQCQGCHGVKGGTRNGASFPLNKLSFIDFEYKMEQYALGALDQGQGFVMQPYGDIVDDNDVKNIFMYIKNLNPHMQKKDKTAKK